MAAALRAAGVRSVNISLDTLDRDVYSQITGRDFHAQVLEGIEAAIAAGFEQIKLNAVLMRGRNEDQLIPLDRVCCGSQFDPAFYRDDARKHERGSRWKKFRVDL